MEIKTAVTRAGIFLFVYSLMLGLPIWLGYRTGFNMKTMVLMAVFASLGPIIYNKLQAKAEGILLAQQRRYQQILLQASSGMVREHNLGRLLKLIVYVIRRAVRIKFAAAFLDDPKSQAYTLRIIRNGDSSPRTVSYAYDHPLVMYVKEHQELFNIEEMPNEMQ